MVGINRNQGCHPDDLNLRIGEIENIEISSRIRYRDIMALLLADDEANAYTWAICNCTE
jgi:hypothetical protein